MSRGGGDGGQLVGWGWGGEGLASRWRGGSGHKLFPKFRLSSEESSADDKSSLLNLPVSCTMVLKHTLILTQVMTALTYLAVVGLPFLAMFVLPEG